MLTIKRIVVLLVELAAELLLLGTLIGVLMIPLPEFIRSLFGVWALALAVGVMLYLNGYYLTRAFVGVVWRSQKPWLYPAIAASLFVAHTHVVYVRLEPDISQRGQETELPLLAGGLCIVFACAYAGNWLLRKWTKPGSTESGPQSHQPDPVGPDEPEIAPEG